MFYDYELAPARFSESRGVEGGLPTLTQPLDLQVPNLRNMRGSFKLVLYQ